MKKIFILTQSLWNGTVLIKSINTAFLTQELAEQTLHKLKEVNNKESKDIDVSYNIKEIVVYSNEKEVPILNR